MKKRQAKKNKNYMHELEYSLLVLGRSAGKAAAGFRAAVDGMRRKK